MPVTASAGRRNQETVETVEITTVEITTVEITTVEITTVEMRAAWAAGAAWVGDCSAALPTEPPTRPRNPKCAACRISSPPGDIYIIHFADHRHR